MAALRNQGQSLWGMVMAEYAMRSSKRSLGIVEELMSLGFVTGGMLVIRLVAGAETHHGMPILPFVLSGITLFWMFRTTLFRVAQFKTAKINFKSNPRITALDVLASRAILNTMFYTGLAFPIFILLYLIGLSPFMQSPGTVFLLFMLMGLWGFGAGLCFGALFLVVPFTRMIVAGMMMALMWVSGIMFIWPEVPYMVRGPFSWNPLFNAMELMRTAYFKSYQTAVGSWSYFLAVVFCTLALGLMLERVSRQRAEAGVYRRGADPDMDEELM